MIPRLIFISIVGQTIPLLILYWIICRTTIKGTTARKIGLALLGVELITFLVFLLLHLYAVDAEGLPYSLTPFSNLYVGIGYCIMLYVLAEIIIYLYRRFSENKQPYPAMKLRRWGLTASVVLTIILCLWGYSNYAHPIVSHYDIEIHAQPHHRDKMRIVLVTDIHISDITKAKQVEHLGDMIKEQNPDYVMVGGDMIDFYLKYADKPDVNTAMDHLFEDKSKIFYVLGNHEHYCELEEKTEWLKKHGRLLIDEYEEIEPGIYLIGRDDYFNKARKPLSEIVQGIPANGIRLLLDHTPIAPEDINENKINLAMHGHTHHGQLFPATLLTDILYKKAYGHYEMNGTHYVISSGYGVSTTPLRIGTHSEITVLDITFVAPK